MRLPAGALPAVAATLRSTTLLPRTLSTHMATFPESELEEEPRSKAKPSPSFQEEHNITLAGNLEGVDTTPLQTFENIVRTDPVTSEVEQLPPRVQKFMASKGYESPTPIQAQSLPLTLAGRDVVAVAQTGSGKTMGFLVPLMWDAVARGQSGEAPARPGRRYQMVPVAPVAVVLAPTRELAQQIEKEAQGLAKAFGCSTMCVYGGQKRQIQARAKRGEIALASASLWHPRTAPPSPNLAAASAPSASHSQPCSAPPREPASDRPRPPQERLLMGMRGKLDLLVGTPGRLNDFARVRQLRPHTSDQQLAPRLRGSQHSARSRSLPLTCVRAPQSGHRTACSTSTASASSCWTRRTACSTWASSRRCNRPASLPPISPRSRMSAELGAARRAPVAARDFGDDAGGGRAPPDAHVQRDVAQGGARARGRVPARAGAHPRRSQRQARRQLQHHPARAPPPPPAFPFAAPVLGSRSRAAEPRLAAAAEHQPRCLPPHQVHVLESPRHKMRQLEELVRGMEVRHLSSPEAQS